MNQSQRGGRRPGAGRKSGTGAYKEATVVKRIPESALPVLEEYLALIKDWKQSDSPLPPPSLGMRIPVALDPVRAGFLSEAGGQMDDYVDFNEYLVRHPQDTIGVYAEGDSMVDAGIAEGDLLIVDRKATVRHRDIVVAQVDEAFTVKRLLKKNQQFVLQPENAAAAYPPLVVQAHQQMQVVGVVTFVIKRL